MLALVCALALVTATDPKPTPNPRQVVERYLSAALAGKFDAAVTFVAEGNKFAEPENARKLKELITAKSLALPTVLVSDKRGYAMAVSAPVALPEEPSGGADRGCLIFTLKKAKDGKWVLKDIGVRSADEAAKRVKELKKADANAKGLPATKS